MIRLANEGDLPRLGDLLRQVCLVHHKGRPDIFKIGRKYSDDELLEILKDDSRPILVYADKSGRVEGYCFCILKENAGNSALTDLKTLYIDDLCVDENMRGQGIGKALYRAAVALARKEGCYNLTLNVWSCNPDAMGFYRSLGLTEQKIGMETVL